MAVDLAASREDPDLVALFLSSRAKEPAGKLGRDFSPKTADGTGWTELHCAAALSLRSTTLCMTNRLLGGHPRVRDMERGRKLSVLENIMNAQSSEEYGWTPSGSS